MGEVRQWAISQYEAAKREMRYSIGFTLLWGLAAHGYMFLNNSITHDSIDEFLGVSGVTVTKIAAGRILAPLVHNLRGEVTSFWLLGLVSLLLIGFAVFFAVRMFEITDRWTILLVSGIFSTNLTVIALTATFIQDLDCDSLALLAAVLAAFLWRRQKWGFLLGMILTAVQLGLYQSYISVTITLILFACIIDLMRDQSAVTVVLRGLRGIAMVVGGGLLYLALMKTVSIFVGIAPSEQGYNSLGLMRTLSLGGILKSIQETWAFTIGLFINAPSLYGQMSPGGGTVCMFVLGINSVLILKKLFSRSGTLLEKALLAVLYLLLPLAMNLSRILSNGMSHDLMYFAVWLTFLLMILLVREICMVQSAAGKKMLQLLRPLSMGLILAVLWSNLQIANIVYTSKRFVQDANLSLFTRITYSMEACDGYVPGETPVAFIGQPQDALLTLPEQFSRYQLTGSTYHFAIGFPVQAHYQCYYRYVLMNPAVIATDELVRELESYDEVRAMPNYPAAGSVAMVHNVMVVKLGNPQ